MSTRSRIGVIRKSGKVESVYCHFDGYPRGVGKELLDNWKDMDEINKMLAFGDMSCLGKDSDTCEFYHRDRNEDFESTRSIISDINNLSTEAYNYLFDEQTETWSFSRYSENTWIPLNQEAIDKD
jgi:hypothetical protein